MSDLFTNIPSAKRHISTAIQAGLCVLLTGSPGMGKSAVGIELADLYNLLLIDVRLSQCDPTDLLGFPTINQSTQKSEYLPFDTFPIEGDELPEGKSGWLIFLDEFNSADEDVQKAAYKLLNERMVGQTKLHKNVAMLAAGNLDTDNALVQEMSSALGSRLIHIKVKSDPNAWLEWAYKAEIDSRVTSMIEFKPALLNTFNPDSQTGEKTYACGRTWHFVSRSLPYMDLTDQGNSLVYLAGTIGEGPAREFLSFLKVYASLPKITEIVASPSTTRIPHEPSHLYALSGSLAGNATKHNIDEIMQYMARVNPEYQVSVIRAMIRANQELRDSPAIEQWLCTQNTVLFN
jgi:hypothetical protein